MPSLSCVRRQHLAVVSMNLCAWFDVNSALPFSGSEEERRPSTVRRSMGSRDGRREHLRGPQQESSRQELILVLLFVR